MFILISIIWKVQYLFHDQFLLYMKIRIGLFFLSLLIPLYSKRIIGGANCLIMAEIGAQELIIGCAKNIDNNRDFASI